MLRAITQKRAGETQRDAHSRRGTREQGENFINDMKPGGWGAVACCCVTSIA